MSTTISDKEKSMYLIAAAILHKIGNHPHLAEEKVHNCYLSKENIAEHHELDPARWFDNHEDLSFYDLPWETRDAIKGTLKAIKESDSTEDLLKACRACIKLGGELDDDILGISPPKGINLSQIPEFKDENCEIVTSTKELEVFILKLRQPDFSREKLEEKGFFERTKRWLNSDTPERRAFYIIERDPPNLGRNDEWGSHFVHECLAFEHLGEIKITKEEKVFDFYD
jgi:hypothetical protein